MTVSQSRQCPAGVQVIEEACRLLSLSQQSEARRLLAHEYPFTPLRKEGRRYSLKEATLLFMRDGFIDRYSGARLLFPGTLRLLSTLFPEEFPYHRNWKLDSCHGAFYELFPTIDHVVPVARGGSDRPDNWVTTSMLRNSAKSSFTLEELGWDLHPPGDLAKWDGMMGWFISYGGDLRLVEDDPGLSKWFAAAQAASEQKRRP